MSFRIIRREHTTAREKAAAVITALGILGIAGGAALGIGEHIQVHEHQLVDVDPALPLEIAGGGLVLFLAGGVRVERTSRTH